jgi:hypothetical protein
MQLKSLLLHTAEAGFFAVPEREGGGYVKRASRKK